MTNIFQLPSELLVGTLNSQFPCRELQIRTLLNLLSPASPNTKSIILHGVEATGKTSITNAILETLSATCTNDDASRRLRYAIVKSAECITGRHLLERTVGLVAEALEQQDYGGRCDSLAQLVVDINNLLERHTASTHDSEQYTENNVPPTKLVLVFDGIDKQRDAPPTLLPALARLGEIIPNLTTVFIVSFPKPRFLHLTGAPHLNFPPYSKAEALRILSQTPPPLFPLPSDEVELQRITKDTKEIWTRFCSAVWDTLARHSGRSIPSFRTLCTRLWPSFTAPLLTTPPTFTPKEFSKLLVAQRSLFQSEATLIPTITPLPKIRSTAIQLPYVSKLLLVAAYLASYNPSRTDLTHFSSSIVSKRKKKGGGTAKTKRGKPGTTRHRKIERRLLGPQAFVMERCMAIFQALCVEARGSIGRLGGNADVQMAMKTLESLRLVGKTSGNADELEGGTKWRVCVGWDVVRNIARGVGVEVEDFVGE